MNLSSRRILVVSGLSAPKNEWEAVLTMAGYSRLAFALPDTALSALRHGSFDLVLLDEVLSEGFSAASLAVEIRDQLGVPVVFAGRAEDPAAFHRLKEADPFGFITLPWSAPGVRAQVELALHRLDHERERLRMLPGRLLAHERISAVEAMLPICASCKKISSHEGRWTKLEEYFGRHAQVQFTHSFCPECEQRLYGSKPQATQHVQREREK